MPEENHAASPDEGIDNTTGIARETACENTETIATLLGPIFRLPKAGVIRPGIKVLKKGCSDRDREIYTNMTAEGATWDEIDRILGSSEYGKSKLIPTNVDYFTITNHSRRKFSLT